MITRTQAEALLTLAESLEACERLDIKFVLAPSGIPEFKNRAGDYVFKVGDWMNSMDIRAGLHDLYPKSET